jgi:GMP synthase (glutamine-hydrolysing)
MELRVLVIQHVASEPPGSITSALAAAGVDMTIVRVHEGQPVPRALPAGFAGLVVMGGPMAVYESHRHPHLDDELALIFACVKAGIPVLGVCLGSQLLAAALGAKITPGGRKEIGWYSVWLEDAASDDPLFAGIESPFMGFHWHGDVFPLPAGAVALARSEMTPLQAFRHGANAYGLLFHLEVTGAQVSGMAADFAGELRAAGITPGPITAGVAAHGGALEALGRRVFARWAALLRR